MQDSASGPERKRRLRGLIEDAFDTLASTANLSTSALEKSVDLVADKIGSIPKPSTDEVAAIVKVALQKTGEGFGVAAEAAGEVAGAAGDIAEKIVEGLPDLDVSA